MVPAGEIVTQRAVSKDAVNTFLRMSEAGVSPEEGQAGALPMRIRRRSA